MYSAASVPPGLHHPAAPRLVFFVLQQKRPFVSFRLPVAFVSWGFAMKPRGPLWSRPVGSWATANCN